MEAWPGRHNYQFNSATVLRDLYRLVSIVLGDETLMKTTRENDALRDLRDQFLEDELVHLLVGTGVTNRIQLEHMRGPREDEGEPSFKPLGYKCGKLQPDAQKNEFVPLTFYEACNKIIHASNIVAQTTGEPEKTPMRPELALRGQQGKKTWVAHLDLVEYVRASMLNFEDGI